MPKWVSGVRQTAEFHKLSLIEQEVNPFPGGQFAPVGAGRRFFRRRRPTHLPRRYNSLIFSNIFDALSHSMHLYPPHLRIEYAFHAKDVFGPGDKLNRTPCAALGWRKAISCRGRPVWPFMDELERRSR